MAERVDRVRTYCVSCSSHCAVVGVVEDGQFVAVEPDRGHPAGGICAVSKAGPEVVYNSGRLLTPLRRTRPKTDPDPGWQPIGWDEALSLAAERLRSIRWRLGPEAVAFARGTQSTSSASDWLPYLQRLANAFGTPNYISTTHVCQWARDAGSAYTYGVGMPSPQFEEARLIVLWGTNPASTNEWIWRRVLMAVKHGAKLIVVDPRRTETARRASLWLAPRPGTDAALILGLIRWQLAEGSFDRGFMAQWSNGPFLADTITGKLLRERDLCLDGSIDRFVGLSEAGEVGIIDPTVSPGQWPIAPVLFGGRELHLPDGRVVYAKTALQLLQEEVESYTPERVEELTGVAAEKVVDVARLWGTVRPLCYYTHNGIEQHVNTAQTNRALCILYGLSGSFDTPGGNTIMGKPRLNAVAGTELISPRMVSRRLGLVERPLGAPRVSVQAYNFYRAVVSGEPYPVRGLVSFGGNLVTQSGDAVAAGQALEQLDFYLHVDLFENPTSRFADILLPAASFWESAAVGTSFEAGSATAGWVQFRPPVVPPPGEARPDVEIIFRLAVALGLGPLFWNGDVETAWSYELAPSGTTLDDLKNLPGGLRVPVDTVYRKYAREIPAGGRVEGFATPTRKLEVYSERFQKSGYDPLPTYDGPAFDERKMGDLRKRFPITLTSAKIRCFSHSQHRGIPSLRRRHPEPTVELHPTTAAECGVSDGEWVIVATPKAEIRVRLAVTDRILPGVAAAQAGWWEECEELGLPGYNPLSSAGANLAFVLANDPPDPISGSVPARSYACAIRPVDEV